MLDCHCHLDRFEDPVRLAAQASARDVFIVAVTALPSHFQMGLSHVQKLNRVRLAIGLHPLAAAEHERERVLFCDLLPQTSFVGEVGLDFSREGRGTKQIQTDTFRLVAEKIAGSPKFISLHSRGAETAVLDTLTEFQVTHTVFHWFSGPLGVLDEVVRQGHFFSVNPAMTRSAKGKAIIERIPPERVLTETDGPYVDCCSEPAKPWHVECVEQFLSSTWNCTPDDARSRIWSNFRRLLANLGLVATSEA
jgi:TatD DNase family protein